jgi:hypothetical protein
MQVCGSSEEREALVLKYWLKRGAGKGSRGRKTGDGCGTVSSAEGAEMDCEDGTRRAQKRGGGEPEEASRGTRKEREGGGNDGTRCRCAVAAADAG